MKINIFIQVREHWSAIGGEENHCRNWQGFPYNLDVISHTQTNRIPSINALERNQGLIDCCSTAPVLEAAFAAVRA